jgi:hypothetical protein
MKAWRIDYAAWASEKQKIERNRNIDLLERKNLLTNLGPEPERPLEPTLLIGDLTLEGLAKAWPNMHPSLGLFSAEGVVFAAGHAMRDDNIAYSAGTLSKLWDGHGAQRIRALDGISMLPGRRLAMHLMIQPDAAGSFLQNPVLRDQGLLSRVFVASVASVAGTRFYRDKNEKDENAIRAYGERILEILEEPPALAPEKRNELAPRTLPFSKNAKDIWVEFYDHIEKQCGEGGEFFDIRDFAAKAAEHAARIAGVLTLVQELGAAEINHKAMLGSVMLADWYANEALRLHKAGRTDPRLLRAKTLLDWLQSRPDRTAGFREILRLGPNATRTKAAADEALAILFDHRLIAEVSQRPRIIRAVEAAP